MILCAAYKVKFFASEKEIVVPGWRHSTILDMLNEISFPRYKILDEGFITTDNEFLNRTEALKHALLCGQLTQSVRWYKEDHNEIELFSEDLY